MSTEDAVWRLQSYAEALRATAGNNLPELLQAIDELASILAWIAANPDTAAALAAGTMVGVEIGREVAWLVERPRTPDSWEQWWHPTHGWTRDSLRALRFAREEDAADYIKENRFTANVKAAEHIWLAAVSPPASDKGQGGKP